MRLINLFTSVLFFFICQILSAQTNYTVNEAWSFSIGNNPESQAVSIPHTWNNYDAVDEIPGYYRGEGWYRRNIFIGNEAKGKQVYMQFEGANQTVELYVNKNYVGKHLGGYTQFNFEITQHIKENSFNLFEIKVDNSHNPDIPPLSADFTFFGGIYRDISLLFKEDIHISPEDFASSGVYISTQVSDEKASVEAKVLLKNSSLRERKVLLIKEIVSPDGKLLSKTSHNIKIRPQEKSEVTTPPVTINTPKLWSPDSPSLYTLRSILVDTQTSDTLDVVSENFGLRWFEFTTEKGFILNGKPLKLIGTNRHQCREGIGNALTDEQHIQDIVSLKKMGGNFLRIAHYPQDPIVLQLCDKLGIITMIEIPLVNEITQSKAFLDNSLYMAEEMVKQSFNHPSLVIWAYMNEILLRPPYATDTNEYKEYSCELHKQASAIEKLIRKLDASRYTLIPFHSSLTMYKEANLITIPQLVGWNLYQGWYGGTFSGFDSFLDNFKKEYPNTPVIITEYGADVDPRLHSFLPERFDYTAEYANLYHEHYLKAIMERPFVVGAAIWNLNDFYSEERGNAVPHVNSKGIASLGREPKDTYFLYQANFLKTPFLSIGSKDWKQRAGISTDRQSSVQPIKIYTNLPQIEVTHNGKSLGNFIPKDKTVSLDIAFTDGENRIKAKGEYEQNTVEDFYITHFELIPDQLSDSNFKELNVMLGSNRYFEARNSDICWIPEKEYTAGSWGYIGGEAFKLKTAFGVLPASDLEIINTDQDPVFQTQRVGLDGFKADVPDGSYAIYLYWAHLVPDNQKEDLAYNLGNNPIYETGDDYTFNVKVNKKMFLENFDIPQQIGYRRAIIKKTEITTTNGQGIHISFEPIGKPYLNAIRIVKLD